MLSPPENDHIAEASEGLWARWLLPLVGALLASSFFHLTCPTAEETLTVVPGGGAAVSEQERAYTQNVGRSVKVLVCVCGDFLRGPRKPKRCRALSSD